MNKKIFLYFFLFFLKLNVFIRSEIIDETIDVRTSSASNVVFFCLANKGLLPNVNYTKSFKYCDFYCGSSNGLELYFINKQKFRLGFFSFRYEFLNFLFNTLVTMCDKNIGYYLRDDFLLNFLTGFVVSIINIKFGPISINLLDLHLFRFMFPVSIYFYPNLRNGFKGFMRDNVIIMNSGIISNIYFFMMLLFPNVKIDISQLIYNVKNKKSFFNTLRF